MRWEIWRCYVYFSEKIKANVYNRNRDYHYIFSRGVKCRRCGQMTIQPYWLNGKVTLPFNKSYPTDKSNIPNWVMLNPFIFYATPDSF